MLRLPSLRRFLRWARQAVHSQSFVDSPISRRSSERSVACAPLFVEQLEPRVLLDGQLGDPTHFVSCADPQAVSAPALIGEDQDNDEHLGREPLLLDSGNSPGVETFASLALFTKHWITPNTTADDSNSGFAADMDGDGDTDVRSASAHDDTITWYENASTLALPVLSFQLDGVTDSGITGDDITNFTTINIVGTTNPLQEVLLDLDGDDEFDDANVTADALSAFAIDTHLPSAVLIEPTPDFKSNTDSGFIDVQWTDTGAADIDPAAFDPGDVTITGVNVDSVELLGGGLVRYRYDDDADALPSGKIDMTFAAGEVPGQAANANVEQTASFTFAPIEPEIDVLLDGAGIVDGEVIPTEYHLTDMGEGIGWAVNDLGQAIIRNDSVKESFFWSNGTKTLLPSSFTVSFGAINNNGVVAGSKNEASQPATWQNGVIVELGTFGGEHSGMALGINDYDVVVGYSSIIPGTSSTMRRAFRYESSTGIVNIGTLPSGGPTKANDINTNGTITGSAYLLNDNGSIADRRAFLWDNGSFTDLGTLGRQSDAWALNDHDVVVGGSYVANGQHAFIYDGAMRDIGTLGGSESIAHDINNDGIVVGWAQNQFNQSRAFVYDEINGMRDLSDLTPDLFGWSSLNAFGVSDSGHIVGSGHGDFHGEHAFLLTAIPLPIAFGPVFQGDPAVSHTFTIANNGTGTLNIAAIQVSSPFSVSPPTSSSLAPGETTDFVVTLTTDTIGMFVDEISFANNDADESPFNFAIQGIVAILPPVLSFRLDGVTDSGVPGDDITNFTTINIVGTTDPLQEVLLDLDGDDEFDDASVTADALGAFAFNTLALTEGPNDIALQATNASGTTEQSETIILDTQPPSAVLIEPTPDRETAADSGFIDVQWTDTGAADIDPAAFDPGDVTITGVNVDSVELLGDGLVRYRYDDDADALPSGKIDMTFAAGEVPDQAANANVEQPASFTFAPIEPEIDVLLDGAGIVDGEVIPIAFGPVFLGDPAVSQTFTIANNGTSTLNIAAIQVSSPFSVSPPASSSLLPGETTDFAVTLATNTAGTFDNEVSFTNNDANESPFNFAIQGAVHSVAPNEPPALVSAPITVVTEDAAYDYLPVVDDPNVGDTLTFTLLDSPPWMNFDAATGRLTGTPQNMDVGQDNVSLRVEDAAGLFDTQIFNIDVANAPPIFLTDVPPPQTLLIGQFFGSLDPDVDDEGDGLTTFQLEGPDWLTIDPLTGALDGRPTLSTDIVDDVAIRIIVNDGNGATAEQNTTVTTQGQVVLLDPTVWRGNRVIFNDANGSKLQVRFGGRNGTATLTRAVAPQPVGSFSNLDQADVFGIELSAGTDTRTSITLRAAPQRGAGDRVSTLDLVVGDGSLRSIDAGGIDLIGDGINLTGDLLKITFGNVGVAGDRLHTQVIAGGLLGQVKVVDIVDGSDIIAGGDIHDRRHRTTIQARELRGGVDITLSSLLSNLTVAQWTGGSLTAPSATTINVRGDRRSGLAGRFGAEVTLTGSPVAAGQLTLKRLKVRETIDASVMNIVGGVGSISAVAWNGGSLTVDQIKSLKLNGSRRTNTPGDLSADVIVSGAGVKPGGTALGSLAVAGAIRQSDLTIGDNGLVGRVTAGRMLDSVFRVGFAADDDDDVFAGGRFNDRGRIKAVTIKGLRGSVGDAFVNSVIASSKIDRVSIQSVQTDNGTTRFGLLASADDGQRIQSVVTRDPVRQWDPLTVDDDLVGDFHVWMIANPS